VDFDFLSPIDERLLAHNLMLPEQVIGRNLSIHTQKDGIPKLTDVRVALVSLEPPLVKGEPLHLRFRQQFYQLFVGNWDFPEGAQGIAGRTGKQKELRSKKDQKKKKRRTKRPVTKRNHNNGKL
jgi:hypothetical protein